MRKLTPSFFKAKKCMCWQCIVYRKRRSQDLWTIPPQRIRNLRRDKVCIWDLFVFCLSCFCLVLCCVVCVFVCVCFVFVVVVYFERQVFEKRYYMYMTELTIETYLWILVQLSYQNNQNKKKVCDAVSFPCVSNLCLLFCFFSGWEGGVRVNKS